MLKAPETAAPKIALPERLSKVIPAASSDMEALSLELIEVI
ncbi:MAG: hypothetical protein AB7V04_11200 [Desulfomonilaceae bacterium]